MMKRTQHISDLFVSLFFVVLVLNLSVNMTSTPFKNITFNHVSGISASIGEALGYYGFSNEIQMIPEEEKEHEESPVPAENSGKEVKEEYIPLTKVWLLYFSSYIFQLTTDNDIPILHHPLDTSTPPPER